MGLISRVSSRTYRNYLQTLTSSIWTVTSTFALFGFGSSSLVCSSLGIISGLIGERHQSTAAFVYSINSLFDKVATGVFVVIIKQWIQDGLLYAQFLSIGI